MGEAVPWGQACKEWISNHLALCLSNCLIVWEVHFPKNVANLIQNAWTEFAKGLSLCVTQRFLTWLSGGPSSGLQDDYWAGNIIDITN